MKTISGLLRKYLLAIESGPAKIIAAEDRVGKMAHHPGYRFNSLRKQEPISIVASPMSESALACKLLVTLMGLKANTPPTAICQNRQKGKQKANCALIFTAIIFSTKQKAVYPSRIYSALDLNLVRVMVMSKGQRMQNCSYTPSDHKCNSGLVFTFAPQYP